MAKPTAKKNDTGANLGFEAQLWAAADKIAEGDEADTVFGKRWGYDVFRLTEQDIEALRQGQYLALDIQGEYVAYLSGPPAEPPHD